MGDRVGAGAPTRPPSAARLLLRARPRPSMSWNEVTEALAAIRVLCPSLAPIGVETLIFDRKRRFLSYHIQRSIYLPFWASDIQMSLPRKQNRDEDERLVPHVPTWQSVESKKVGLRNSGTPEVAKFSKLSAQMVELSLQQTQRDPTLHDTFPAKVKEVSSPLLWPTTPAAPLHPPPQAQGTPRESKVSNYWKPNYWKKIRCNLDNWLAGARVSGSAAVRNLYEHAKSAQKKFALSNFRTNFRTETKRRDGTASRRWTSTGVAALSAVLVVGVISVVRHYAYTPNTPQNRGNTSPVIPAMQDISQPRRSSVVDTNRAAAAMQHPVRSSAAKPRIRKIRHKKDDDYVAQDTYVYYGNKGKPAR